MCLEPFLQGGSCMWSKAPEALQSWLVCSQELCHEGHFKPCCRDCVATLGCGAG